MPFLSDAPIWVGVYGLNGASSQRMAPDCTVPLLNSYRQALTTSTTVPGDGGHVHSPRRNLQHMSKGPVRPRQDGGRPQARKMLSPEAGCAGSLTLDCLLRHRPGLFVTGA